eukprot:jgi/Ulvmu1/100/UM001_0103.1
MLDMWGTVGESSTARRYSLLLAARRQVQALKDIQALVQQDSAALEEARKARLAPALNKVLAQATDEAVLDATSSLISVLTGATVHVERTLIVSYPIVGDVAVHECSLGEGVGARLWGISHAFNKHLIANQHLLRGASVLEIGSGVGSTGVVASMLGPSSVTVTDLTTPLLQNLLQTVRLNSKPAPALQSDATEPRQAPAAHTAPPACGAPPAELPELEFSDAESVSDEAELFAADSEEDSGDAEFYRGGAGVAVGGAAGDGGAAQGDREWDVGVVRVRVMDWKREWDMLRADGGSAGAAGGLAVSSREDDTTSALDALQPDPQPAPIGGSRANGSAAGHSAPQPPARDRGTDGATSEPDSPRDTFDVPGDAAGLPPPVPRDETFAVVVGCEVLYELPHAAWIAATIARRLRRCGTAWIAGAVRDLAVYDSFDEHLRLYGLGYSCTPIAPVEGGSGLGNKEDIYEDGYRLYHITHSQ